MCECVMWGQDVCVSECVLGAQGVYVCVCECVLWGQYTSV